MIFHFNSIVAQDYDVDCAIFLDHIKFWTLKNIDNKKMVKDGYCWTYNTYDQLTQTLSFFSKYKIRRIVEKCVKSNLIVKSNYNKFTYDRTNWYAITYKIYSYYEELIRRDFLNTIKSSLIAESSPDYEQLLAELESLIDSKSVDDEHNEHIDKKQVINDKKRQSKKIIIYHYTIDDMLQDNPHEIPEELIQDWVKVRENKRATVTKTGWNDLNGVLNVLYMKGIKPIDAFRKMISSGWSTLSINYFDFDSGRRKDEPTIIDAGSMRPETLERAKALVERTMREKMEKLAEDGI